MRAKDFQPYIEQVFTIFDEMNFRHLSNFDEKKIGAYFFICMWKVSVIIFCFALKIGQEKHKDKQIFDGYKSRLKVVSYYRIIVAP